MVNKDYWKAAGERVAATFAGDTPDRVPYLLLNDEAFGARICGQTIRSLLADPKNLAERSIEVNEFLGVDHNNLITVQYAGPYEAYAFAVANGKKNAFVWHDYATPFMHQGVLAGTEKDIDNLQIPDHTKDGAWPAILEAGAIVQEKTGVPLLFVPSLTWSNVQQLRGSAAYLDVKQNPELLLKLCQKIYDSQIDLFHAFTKVLGKPTMVFNCQYGFNRALLNFDDAWKFEGQFVARFCKETNTALTVHNCGFEPYWDEMIDKFAQEGVHVALVNGCRPKDLNYWVKFREKYPEIVIMGANIYVNDEILLGTPEDVEKIVKENIRMLAPLKRFIVSPLCCPQWGVPLQNLLAVKDAVRKYGTYPININ